MGATVAAVTEWAGSMFAASATADGAVAGTMAAGSAATAGGGAGALAGVAGGTVGTGAGVAAGAAGASSLASSFVGGLGSALGGTLASQLLAPKQAAPGVKEPMAQPDPLAQQKAREQSIAEQLARRGRASTILTNDSGSGKLGG